MTLSELMEPETLRLHLGELTPEEIPIARAAVRLGYVMKDAYRMVVTPETPTLRDQFAMAALVGLHCQSLQEAATAAYRLADMMLAARGGE
ncbi:MAG: hypothetical protein LBE24_04210 [Methylobacillus sp.]|jgi:hypothetical protein|nr:hypothetical protein [Methylobacillus sp.]